MSRAQPARMEMAAHYGTAVLPGRVRHPRNKAKVETAVLIVERFILAKLRNRRLLSLGELSAAIHQVQGDLNARLTRKLGASRREFFDSIDCCAAIKVRMRDNQGEKMSRSLILFVGRDIW